MYQRRRQAASPVSLLAVTFVFVWACSSGGQNEVNAVTASGGAGSNAGVDGSTPAGRAPTEAGAAGDSGAAGWMNAGSSTGGAEPSKEDAGPLGGAPTSIPPDAGAPGAGGSSPESPDAGGSAGAATVTAGAANAGAGAAGAPVIVEPVCEAAPNQPTEGLFLPCEVSAAFFVCRNCHSNPPVKAVNHPYVTFQDIKPMAGEIYGVIKSGYMPWPPYTITPYARDVLVKWLGKDGTCAKGVSHGCQ